MAHSGPACAARLSSAMQHYSSIACERKGRIRGVFWRMTQTHDLPRKWSVELVRLCGFGAGFEDDVIAEAFEAALEIGNSATLADLVEIGVSEIAIDHAPGEHVIGGHDNLVSNGQGGTQRAAPGFEAVEFVPQIACLWFAPRKWRRRPGSCADARCPYGHARSSACR